MPSEERGSADFYDRLLNAGFRATTRSGGGAVDAEMEAAAGF